MEVSRRLEDVAERIGGDKVTNKLEEIERRFKERAEAKKEKKLERKRQKEAAQKKLRDEEKAKRAPVKQERKYTNPRQISAAMENCFVYTTQHAPWFAEMLQKKREKLFEQLGHPIPDPNSPVIYTSPCGRYSLTEAQLDIVVDMLLVGATAKNALSCYGWDPDYVTMMQRKCEKVNSRSVPDDNIRKYWPVFCLIKNCREIAELQKINTWQEAGGDPKLKSMAAKDFLERTTSRFMPKSQTFEMAMNFYIDQLSNNAVERDIIDQRQADALLQMLEESVETLANEG